MSTNFVFDKVNPTTHIYNQRYDALKSILSSAASDTEYIYNLGFLFECIFEYWEETGKEEGLGVELFILNEIAEITNNLRTRINSNPELAFEFSSYTLFQSIWGFLIDLRIKVQEDIGNPDKDLIMNLINQIMSVLIQNNQNS